MTTDRPASGVPPLTLAMAAIGAAALAVPMAVLADPPALPAPAPHVRPAVARAVAARQRVLPPAELPAVEPVELVSLTPDDARVYNAAVPFVTGPKPAARPFRFAGTVDELARATDCLAAGILYEAGDDAVGERAVAQVVLNRLRHPAFPKSVCGVVFQGQERRTGCQFTFTCDGALGRAPSEAGWRRAREIATRALAGDVYRPVGLATHYHTDWVVPYWSASLDKVAEVHTHLFFRWSGWWGTPPAFDRRPIGGEPVIQRIAFLSEAHRPGGTPADGGVTPLDATTLLAGPAPVPVAEQDATFLQVMPTGVTPALWATYARRLCGDRAYCKVLGWTDARPAALPLTSAQQAHMAFSYLRDRATGFDKALWNCTQVKRADPGQCMKDQPPLPVFRPTLEPSRSGSSRPGEPGTLTGVRRRGEAAEAPPRPPALRPDLTPPGTSPAATP